MTSKRNALSRHVAPPARQSRKRVSHSGAERTPASESLIASPETGSPLAPASENGSREEQSSPAHLIDEARRILACADTLPQIDIADDEVRIVAGLQALRRLAEESIETLIVFLDESDGDTDECEPDEDCEPSLGWTHTFSQDCRGWLGRPEEKAGAIYDGEAGDDTGIGDAFGLDFDDEPNHDQEHEMTDDNGIADADGKDFDAEPNDNGIGDDGGLQEQYGGRGTMRFDGSGYEIAKDMLFEKAAFPWMRVKSYEIAGPDGHTYTLVPILPMAVR